MVNNINGSQIANKIILLAGYPGISFFKGKYLRNNFRIIEKLKKDNKIYKTSTGIK